MEFEQFKGVDFSASPGDVAVYRSPDCVNMVADLSGRPVKRYGYECIAQLPDRSQRINGIFRLVKPAKGQVEELEEHQTEENAINEYIFVHAGTKLYQCHRQETGSGTLEYTMSEIYSGMADRRSMAFQMEGQLWILDGKRMLCRNVEKSSTQTVDSMSYAPTTRKGAKPDGSEGQDFEGRNMLSSYAINTFRGDGVSDTYHLNVRKYSNIIDVKVLNNQGEWQTKTYSVNPDNGTVTFDTIPPKPPINGEDNVSIKFQTEPWINEDGDSPADKINGCTFGILWGIGGNNRLVLSGNPKYPNMDFTSEISTPGIPGPTYFPDLNYSMVGQDASPIVGYHRMGGNLVILKKSNEQDATVFLRGGALDEAWQLNISTREGIAGVGAVSPHCMCELRGEPLFLSDQGVYALAESAVTSSQYAQMRSEMINKRLCKESNLHDAVAVEHNGFMHLAVNGNVYVADAAQQGVKGRETQQYQYEWYFWNNIPARVWFKHEDKLWFGTSDGKIMRFHDEYGVQAYNDDGEKITAYWTTPELTFGTYSRNKTLRRVYTKLLPYIRSGVKVLMKVDGAWELLDEMNADVFDFNNLDFKRFTFNTDKDVYIINTRLHRKKRIITTQFRLENDRINEAFGMTSMTIYYSLKNQLR